MDENIDFLNDLEIIKKFYQDDDLAIEQRDLLDKGINLWFLKIKIKKMMNHEQDYEKVKLEYLKKDEKRIYNRLLKQLKEKTREQYFFDEKLVVSPLDKKNLTSYQYGNQCKLNYLIVKKVCTILQDDDSIKTINDYFKVFEESDETLKDTILSLRILNFLEKNWDIIQKYYSIKSDIKNLSKKYFNIKEYESIKKECERYKKMNSIEKKIHQKKIKSLALKLIDLEDLYKKYQEVLANEKKMTEELTNTRKKLEEKGWILLVNEIPKDQIYQYITIFENNECEKFKTELIIKIEKQNKIRKEKKNYIKEHNLNNSMANLLQNNEKTASLIGKIYDDKNLSLLLFLLKGVYDLEKLSLEDIKKSFNDEDVENYELKKKKLLSTEKPKVKQLYL